MPSRSKEGFIDYSNETEELSIKSLVDIGYTPYQAEAYLSKLMIKRLSENDNGCKNEHYNKELRIPPDRMWKFEIRR